MTDLSPNPDSSGHAGDDTSSRPRWVKVLGVIIVVLILVLVVMHLAGGGRVDHTPR